MKPKPNEVSPLGGEVSRSTPTVGQRPLVKVRWCDGYLQTFEADEVRFGSDLLWMRLSDGEYRHIPLRSIRWVSCDPESHENWHHHRGPHDHVR